MLLNKHNLAVADFASKEESRYALKAIQVSKDGTIATDSHRLVKVSLPNKKEENFPQIEGFTPANGELKSFLLSRDAAKDIERQIPKEKSLKILNHVRVGTADSNGAINMLITDLKTSKVFKCKPFTGQFPNHDAVIPKDAPVLEIGLNAEYLAQLAKAAATFSDSHAKHIRVKLYGPDRAMVLECKNSETGQTWTGVCMPQRLS